MPNAHFGIDLALVLLETVANWRARRALNMPFWHRFLYFWHRWLWHRNKTVAKHGHRTDAIGSFSTSDSSSSSLTQIEHSLVTTFFLFSLCRCSSLRGATSFSGSSLIPIVNSPVIFSLSVSPLLE